MALPNFIIDQPVLPRAGRIVFFCLALAAMVSLSACAGVRPKSPEPPSLRSPAATVQIDDVDILAVSPAMESFLERYILPYRDLETRLRLLTLAVVESGVPGFEYDENHTYTAAEAFDRRSGNCISHANMLIALARRAGLDARYQEIAIQRQWTSRNDTILLNKHINVLLFSPRSTYYVDVSGREISPDAKRRVVSDRDAKAMYFNNLGAAALIDRDLPTAYGYIRRAIETSPRVADAWVNLGVVFSRNRQLDDAEMAHKTALRLNSREYSAMNNLYGIYVYQKKYEAAEKLQRRVESHRRNNPYYLLMLANEASDESKYQEATSLLRRAIRIKDDDHRLHFALAKAQYLAGDRAGAERSLLRARELAPSGERAAYSLSLDELIDEH